MKLNSLAVAASLALTASAQPTVTPSSTATPSVTPSGTPSGTPSASPSATPSGTPRPETFGVVAIHSGSGVQYSGFNAALGSLFAGLRDQNATCQGSDDGFATFYIKDEALFLYGPSGNTQQVYVDRSGMGQGKIGYTSGGESGPRNGERTGWAIDESNHLQFDGSSLIACPNSIGGAYSIWASAGVANPAGNKDCVGIAARVEKSAKPVRCTYSS